MLLETYIFKIVISPLGSEEPHSRKFCISFSSLVEKIVYTCLLLKDFTWFLKSLLPSEKPLIGGKKKKTSINFSKEKL